MEGPACGQQQRRCRALWLARYKTRFCQAGPRRGKRLMRYVLRKCSPCPCACRPCAHRAGGMAVQLAQHKQVGRLRVGQQVLHSLPQRSAPGWDKACKVFWSGGISSTQAMARHGGSRGDQDSRPDGSSAAPAAPAHGCVRGLPCSALRSLLQPRS